MKKFLFKLRWVVDYYIIYFTYNPHKIKRYHDYMVNRYGNKYTEIFTGDEDSSK
jgi:hypothetical protein